MRACWKYGGPGWRDKEGPRPSSWDGRAQSNLASPPFDRLLSLLPPLEDRKLRLTLGPSFFKGSHKSTHPFDSNLPRTPHLASLARNALIQHCRKLGLSSGELHNCLELFWGWRSVRGERSASADFNALVILEALAAHFKPITQARGCKIGTLGEMELQKAASGSSAHKKVAPKPASAKRIWVASAEERGKQAKLRP